jgi:hypothetical protein
MEAQSQSIIKLIDPTAVIGAAEAKDLPRWHPEDFAASHGVQLRATRGAHKNVERSCTPWLPQNLTSFSISLLGLITAKIR